MTAVYEKIGTDYAVKRMPDVHWIDQLSQHFRHQRTLINIGAGTGSYEPDQLNVVALEPSTVMIQQRPTTAAPVIRGIAEQLPFKDQTFDIALAILTVHHWTDPCKGLAEMRRVSRKQIVLTWDQDFFAEHFWLVRDYLPQALERESGLATLGAVKGQFDNATVQPLNVPGDCSDGFFGAYWKRPVAYLDPAIRGAISGLALLHKETVSRAMKKLEVDLASGYWHERYADLMCQDDLDLGYRLVINES